MAGKNNFTITFRDSAKFEANMRAGLRFWKNTMSDQAFMYFRTEAPILEATMRSRKEWSLDQGNYLRAEAYQLDNKNTVGLVAYWDEEAYLAEHEDQDLKRESQYSTEKANELKQYLSILNEEGNMSAGVIDPDSPLSIFPDMLDILAEALISLSGQSLFEGSF